MDMPDILLQHEFSVESAGGYDGAGRRVFGAPVTARGFVIERRRRVRNAAGQLVVAEATIWCPLDTAVTVDSRVTLPSGRTATVIAITGIDAGDLPAPSHLELSTT